MSAHESVVPPPAPSRGYRVDHEWIAEMVRRTRAEQGLPPTVQDPVALATAAALLRPMLERARQRATTPPPVTIPQARPERSRHYRPAGVA